jgi:hypothetical protein
MGALFESDLDSGTGWNIRNQADTAWQFGWDFTTMGIPPSPGGSTTGLKMQANLTAGSAAYVWAVTDQIFSGQYVVEFDFWANSVGPFPGGGGGSTEFIGGGVGREDPLWSLNGAALLISGEGGVGTGDWRLYKDSSHQYPASGQYDIDTHSVPASTDLGGWFPGQEPPQWQQDNYEGVQTGAVYDGAPAFAWRHMVITVDSDAGLANFAVDGHSIGTINANIGNPVETAGHAQLIYGDPFSSVGHSELCFGVFDNFVVTPEPMSLALLMVGGLALLRRR